MSRRGQRFRRLGTEVLVENRWHRYLKDRYVLTDGSVGEYFYVDMAGSCGIVPVFDDGTVMLLEVERYLFGRTLLEFPIGGMRPGEEPLAVARKELAEEAGLAADEWTELGAFAPYKGASTEICHFFAARRLESVGQKLEPTERIRTVRVPVDEVESLLLGQDLPDGQSLAGWLLFKRRFPEIASGAGQRR